MRVARFRAALLMVALVACGDKPETGETGADWAMLADEVGDVAFLGAWSAGDRLLVVGGDLGTSNGHGDLVWIDGRSACVEERVSEEPLWWVHGTTEDDWYAVGGAGTILHETSAGRVDETVATDARSTAFGMMARARSGRSEGCSPRTSARSGAVQMAFGRRSLPGWTG